MKLFKYTAMLLLAVPFLSCSHDNDGEDTTGEGSLSIEFDNAYGTSDLLTGTTTYDANGSEKIQIDSIKYIIGNIRLEDENGNTFIMPKDASYFIVNEATDESRFLSLEDVPFANYTKITFGIGVDQEKYLQGADGQAGLLERATAEGMVWSWQAGYKFVRYEGRFTSESITEEAAFAIHMGSHGSDLDNYREVTLELPVSAKVRADVEPEIHIVADLSHILSGSNKLYLEENSQIHIDPENAPKIAENISGMFSIAHVHND